MSEYRDSLITRMIHIYGFEHEATIGFVKMCETYPENFETNYALTQYVEAHEQHPQY